MVYGSLYVRAVSSFHQIHEELVTKKVNEGTPEKVMLSRAERIVGRRRFKRTMMPNTPHDFCKIGS